MDCTDRLLKYYRRDAKVNEPTARFMERIGWETLKSELFSLLPYIPVETVR